MKRLSFISQIRTHIQNEEQSRFKNQYDHWHESCLSVMDRFESMHLLFNCLSDIVGVMRRDNIDQQDTELS